jgi:hypothetical protein
VESPPPDLMARARLFTIAFTFVALIGLAISVVIPFVLPGPRLFTIAIGSCCFILILVAGSRLLRRVLIRGPRPGP